MVLMGGTLTSSAVTVVAIQVLPLGVWKAWLVMAAAVGTLLGPEGAGKLAPSDRHGTVAPCELAVLCGQGRLFAGRRQ
jgi:hypothetical protein